MTSQTDTAAPARSLHTPGPWCYSDVIGGCFVYGSDGRQILAYTSSPDVENRANARLIAAAPDLLAALVAYHEHFGPLEDNIMLNEDCRRCASLARAAIARATGAV